MTVLSEKSRYSPEDLLTLPDGDHYELVNGRLVEKPSGAEASWVAVQVAVRLTAYQHLGWVFGSGAGYQCFPADYNRVRKPDVSFVLRQRLNRIPKGHICIVPDLAVEVVSPNDLYSEVQQKLVEYLDAGVPLVWVVDPESRTVTVHDQSRGFQLRNSDVLTGGDVLPGFRCEVGELFPPIDPTEEIEN
jgi:Uma2 family endonuclease